MFEYLAKAAPQSLANAIRRHNLPSGLLFLAAEIFGRESSFETAFPTLVPLLSHSSPVVREGALYGLKALAETHSAEIARVFHDVALNDSHETIRKLAAEALQSLHG